MARSSAPMRAGRNKPYFIVFLLIRWTPLDVLGSGVWCRKEDYSALRASPLADRAGSSCGRSPSPLRGAVVEPAFCLSGVRIEITQRLGPMRISLEPRELVPQRGLLGAARLAPR